MTCCHLFLNICFIWVSCHLPNVLYFFFINCCSHFPLCLSFPGNLRLSTMPCWPRLVSTTTVETTLSSAQLVANTTGCAHWQLLTLVSTCLCIGQHHLYAIFSKSFPLLSHQVCFWLVHDRVDPYWNFFVMIEFWWGVAMCFTKNNTVMD